MPMPRWLTELRSIHDEFFTYDWTAHLRSLNARLGLTGRDEFGLPFGLPPAWFVGDVEVLQPDEWVLVLSLNQARREEDNDWHLAQGYTSQSYWDHWRWLNREWWEPRFYRPLVRLAAGALGADLDQHAEPSFATSRMVFAELCPYPSRQFVIGAAELSELVHDDFGFGVAARVRRLLADDASPALILVNGVAAVDALAVVEGKRVEFEARRYPSVVRDDKELWHVEGEYTTTSGRAVPLIGFPFLRKPRTHNSYAEVDQLAAFARALLTD